MSRTVKVELYIRMEPLDIPLVMKCKRRRALFQDVIVRVEFVNLKAEDQFLMKSYLS